MAIRFTSEFRSDTGIDYKIEIDDSVFVGSPTTFVVGSEGFTLQYSGETDDIVSPIMSSNVSIPFMVQNALQQTFFEQLVAVQESRFRIKISRWVSGSYKTYWVGYVMQDIAQIEDAPFPYIYELRAVDGLGRLANIDYTFANDVFQNSLALTRMNKILFNCLSSVGTTDLFASTDTFFETCVNWWENNMVYSTTKDAANEIAVDRRIFSTIDDDGNETYSKVIEVLRQLCVSFGTRVYQSNGRFVFEQYSERAAASRIVSTYDRAGAYIATASKSDDVVIDQTVGEARLAGNQFDFLPAIKRCEIEFEQKFVGARVAQLYFTFTRTTAQPIGFISEDSSAVLEIVCPMMHFNINRTPNTIVAVPSYAIAPIFAMTIKIEDVNNPGTFYYFQRTFNGFSATSPYSTPQWTTTPSDYQFDIGNFKFSPYGTAGLSSPVTIQTDQLPVSGELTFQLKQPTLRRVSNGAIYAQPPLYVGLIAGSSIKYDFLANINYISNGQLSPESIVYKASNNATGIDSNLVLELGKTSIADGPLQTGNLAIWNGSIWAGSDQWRKGNSGTYKKLLQLLVTEALALHAKPIRRYNGSFYSSHDISRRYTFDTFDWLFIGGSLNANNENVDGEFFAIARDVTNIVDVNSGLFVGDLAPMSVNKVSGPNSFGGVFNDGSIAGMLVDSDTFSVGPFSQPSAGTARITGTTTVDGDAFFTQDVDVTGDLVVDGTIVIDGMGDVATESWVIAQGYLTAESDTLDSVTDRGNVTTNTINVGGVTSDYVLFDTTATPTPSLGMAYWNTDEGTVSLQVNGVSYELGQKEAWIAKNQTGATITKGTVVMAVGALGASARILVGKMVADGSVSPRYLLGVAAENIANGADGRIIHRGKLRQFNTSAFAVGDVLYCDPTTPGGLTNVEPQAPNLKLAVAFVVASGTNGALAVRIETGARLSEDHDVQLSTLSTGQLLRYNSNRWENWTPNFLTPSNVSGTTNYVSKFTGTNTVGNSQIFDNGTNIGIGTATPGASIHVAGAINSTPTGDGFLAGIQSGYAVIHLNGSAATGSLIDFSVSGTDTKGRILYDNTNNYFGFNTNGSERLRITSTGDVGIGTTTPNGKLQVDGDFYVNGIDRKIMNYNGAVDYGTLTNNSVRFNQNGTERARISTLGNFGIGTTSPSSILEIAGASPVLTINRTSGTSSTINFNSSGSNFASIISNPSNGENRFSIGPAAAWGGFHTFYTDTSERMRITAAGNVGIGTTSPTYKFNVVSNAVAGKQNLAAIDRTAQNFVTFTNPQYSTDASMGLLLRVFPQSDARQGSGIIASGGANNATTDLDLFVTTSPDGLGGTSYSAIKINGLNGNVGIGTTTPGAKLDVVGNTYIRSGILYVDTIASYSTTNVSLASATNLIIPSGNLGIGTTSPAAKLDVIGNIRSSNAFISQGGNLTWTGGAVFMDWQSTYGRFGAYNYTTNAWTPIDLNGGSIYITGGNGNVGIGTTGPGAKLDVIGNARATTLSTTSGLGLNVGAYAYLSQTLSGVMTFLGHNVRASDSVANTAVVQNGGWISSLIKMYYNEGITFHTDTTTYAAGATYPFATNEKMRIQTNGNVGIGTSSAFSRFTVSGALSASTSQMSIVNTEGGHAIIRAGISGVSNNGISFVTANADGSSQNVRMVVSATGSVGIGTTSPSASLQISASGGVIFGATAGGVGTSQITTASAGSPVSSRFAFGTDGTGWQYRIAKNTAGTIVDLVTVADSGNVGIGTTSPAYPLDIVGFANSSSGFRATNGTVDNRISWSSGNVGFLGTISNHPIALNTNATERMRITAAGDVGIGTTSPSAKLHVIGNATVSATLSTVNAKITGTLTDYLNQPGTAGQILSSTGTGIEWITGGGGGGGSTIAVKDEGVSIGSSFTTLDFQGNNIQATASGSTAVITAFNNAGTGSMYVDAVTTNYTPGATFADVEIDSSIIFAASPDAATGSSKLIATVTFGVENVSSFDEFNSFEFRLYDVSQSIVVSNTTHTWTGYMSKNEGATTTVFTFHIPLETDVAPGDEIRVQAKQAASITPEIYYCAITLMEGTV